MPRTRRRFWSGLTPANNINIIKIFITCILLYAVKKMSKKTTEKCPLSGIPCDECGYPGDYCPILEFIDAIRSIAVALKTGEE